MKQTSSRAALLLGLLFDTEGGGNVFLRNSGRLSSDYMVLYIPEDVTLHNISWLNLQVCMCVWPPTKWVSGVLSPAVEQLGCEAGRLTVIIANIKNSWNLTFTPPYVFVACSMCVLKSLVLCDNEGMTGIVQHNVPKITENLSSLSHGPALTHGTDAQISKCKTWVCCMWMERNLRIVKRALCNPLCTAYREMFKQLHGHTPR
jgi:hypothetical protein